VVVELALLCYVFCAADSCGFKFIMCFRVPFLGEIVCPRIVVVAVHGALVMVI
jgi:hypothetical protein